MPGSRMGRRDFLRQAPLLAASAAVFDFGRGPSWLPQQTRGAAARPRFSLAYLTVFGCPPPEMTYIAARAGYDYVSFRPIYMGLPGEPNFELAANAQLLRQTKTALRATGLRVLDIEVARIQEGVVPAAYRSALEVGAELGARHVIASVWTPDRGLAVERYAELCDLAKPLGLSIDLEFVTFANVKTLQDALAVLRSARRENCGLLVDMLHFSRSRVAPPELDAVPREWFHFVHLCDAPAVIPERNDELIRVAREERLYPGEGGIDLAAILQRIPEVPYSIEAPHLARVRELGYAEHAWRCLEAARTCVARLRAA